MEQLHILMVPLMSQSHIIPVTDFAKLLAKRGLNISIITTPLNAIRYKPIIDNSRAQNLKIQMIPIKFPCQDAGLPEGCENLDTLNSLELAKQFFQAFQMLQAPLENLIHELDPKPNCIVSTSSISWTQQVADKFKIPRYLFETISCFTLVCSHNLSQNGIVSDSEPFLVPDIPHKIEFTRAQLPQNTTKASDNLKGVFNKALESAEGTLVNSFQGLEPWYLEKIKEKRGKVWSIGPVSLSNKQLSERSNRGNRASIDEQDCIKWLESKKPKSVIYACFGSLCSVSPQQMKEIGLGLEASNHPFIWVIRKKDNFSEQVEKWLKEERFEERVRGRGLVIIGWAPQVLILSHPSTGGFLTHCGWNSTLEGVCAGVPMITWPMFAEQFYNEKFIVNVLEIGVRIGVERCVNFEKNEDLVKWGQVKKCVESLMEENEEGIKRRIRGEELAEMAKSAGEEGGSSYLNVTMFIQDVMKHVQ